MLKLDKMQISIIVITMIDKVKIFVAAEGHAVGIKYKSGCRSNQKPSAEELKERMEERREAEKRRQKAAEIARKRAANAQEAFAHHQENCQKSH